MGLTCGALSAGSLSLTKEHRGCFCFGALWWASGDRKPFLTGMATWFLSAAGLWGSCLQLRGQGESPLICAFTR